MSKSTIRVNRWLYVLLFGVVLSVFARYYSGWSAMRKFLARGRAYEWLCSPEDLVFNDAYGVPTCDQQLNAITGLYRKYNAFEAIGGILAGVALDVYGPRTTAALGCLFGILSIIGQCYSSKLFDALPMSAVLGGLAVNTIAYPTMYLENLFPDNKSMATNYTIGIQGLGALMPFAFLYLWDKIPELSFLAIWGGLAGCVFVPISILYILSLPNSMNDEEEEQKKAVLKFEPETSMVSDLLGIFLSAPFWAVAIICAVSMFVTETYYLAIPNFASNAVAEFTDAVSWTDFITSMLNAHIHTTIGTGSMMIFHWASMALTMIITLMVHGAGHYINAIFFISTRSFSYCIKYVYARELFHEKYRGTILGALSGVSSAVYLLASFLDNPAIKPESVYMGLICAMPLTVPLIVYLWHYQVHGLKQAKSNKS